MPDITNGQVVPALSQWQGVALIATALVVGALVRLLGGRRPEGVR
jgi:hypothetical protein